MRRLHAGGQLGVLPALPDQQPAHRGLQCAGPCRHGPLDHPGAVVLPHPSPLAHGCALAARGLSILYFTWEPLLRARWAIWLATVTLLVVDSGAAFLGTKQNAFFAVNNIVLLVMADWDYEPVGTERNEGTRRGPVGGPIGAL